VCPEGGGFGISYQIIVVEGSASVWVDDGIGILLGLAKLVFSAQAVDGGSRE
jgi:hypothetical protein